MFVIRTTTNQNINNNNKNRQLVLEPNTDFDFWLMAILCDIDIGCWLNT